MPRRFGKKRNFCLSRTRKKERKKRAVRAREREEENKSLSYIRHLCEWIIERETSSSSLPLFVELVQIILNEYLKFQEKRKKTVLRLHQLFWKKKRDEWQKRNECHDCFYEQRYSNTLRCIRLSLSLSLFDAKYFRNGSAEQSKHLLLFFHRDELFWSANDWNSARKEEDSFGMGEYHHPRSNVEGAIFEKREFISY